VDLFSTIGKVERAEIQYEPNGRSRGTGVVEFDNAETAETAIGESRSMPPMILANGSVCLQPNLLAISMADALWESPSSSISTHLVREMPWMVLRPQASCKITSCNIIILFLSFLVLRLHFCCFLSPPKWTSVGQGKWKAKSLRYLLYQPVSPGTVKNFAARHSRSKRIPKGCF
jgi:RNA recognition motif-containing protein